MADEQDSTPQQAAEQPESTADPLLEDERTDRAVEDIMAHEGDEVLEAQDAAAAEANKEPKRGFWGSIGHFFGLWFGTSKGRWLTFVLVVLAAGVVAAEEPARYWALNVAGVRSSLTVSVADTLTQLPLKGVPVTLGSQTRQTSSDGSVSFRNLKLGSAELRVNQPGFAVVTRRLVVGWGSNPQGVVGLRATGARFTLQVSDYLSGKPLAGVQALSGEATAMSDKQGKIELTFSNIADASAPVSLSKDGYRTDAVKLQAPNRVTAAKMVVARKAVYVSKSSGKYDLYKSDIDGANREVLLAATGSENANITLAVTADGTHAAMVSTRDNQHDADGFLLSTLSLVKVDDSSLITVAHAAQIQLITWSGSRIIFEQVSSDPNTPAASRYSIISYDYASNSRVQLVAAPKINAVFSAQAAVFYALASDPANGSLQPGFYRINPDGTNRQAVFNQDVWSGLRTDYNTFALQTADGWTAYSIPSSANAAISAPANFTSRLYADAGDGKHSLWVNQGALLSYDVAANKDAPVSTQGSLGYPVRWLSDDIVEYRVVTSGETGDYVMSLAGGIPHKVAEVANTYGLSSSQ